MARWARFIVVVSSISLVCLSCRRVAPDVDPQQPRGEATGISDLQILPPRIDVKPRERNNRRRTAESAPATLSQSLPSYPDAALEDEVDCVAHLLFHIETDGTARFVRLEWEQAPPQHHVAAFEASIRGAVAGWRFDPAKRYDFEMDEEGNVDFSGKPVPKARNAIITFRVVNGRARVE